MTTENYAPLHDLLLEAFNRASSGKGRERHASGQPFLEQWIIQGGIKHGPGALLFQIEKKLAEHSRLDADAGDRELLDVINYTAALVLVRRELRLRSRTQAEAPPTSPSPTDAIGQFARAIGVRS